MLASFVPPRRPAVAAAKRVQSAAGCILVLRLQLERICNIDRETSELCGLDLGHLKQRSCRKEVFPHTSQSLPLLPAELRVQLRLCTAGRIADPSGERLSYEAAPAHIWHANYNREVSQHARRLGVRH